MALKKSTTDSLYQARLKQYRLQHEYQTALYFETMPEVDPVYQYCYSTSNMHIPYQDQSVAAWLQAVAQHMNLRKPGHGGETNNVIVIDIPKLDSEQAVNRWLTYVTKELKSKAMKRKTRIQNEHGKQN